MPLPTTYSTGTVSVSNGGTTVTGVGTAWLGSINAGDLFTDPAQGIFARVTADAVSNTSLSINAWPGTELSGDAYEILITPDTVRMQERTRQVLNLLTSVTNTGIGIDAFGLVADLSDHDAEVAGFAYLAIDGDGVSITDPVVFLKNTATSADWSDPIEIRGTGPAGATGATGSTGATGPAGADGSDPGVLLTWDVANDDSDPGTGKIKADNDALGSATLLYIDKANRAGSDIATFLATLDDSTSTNKGTLSLTDPATGAQAIWSVTALTDATGYVKVAVSGHSGATGFSNALPVSLQFSRTGNAGAGTGDVVGPASSVNSRIATFSGTTGKLIQDGGVAVSDLATSTQGGKADTALQPGGALGTPSAGTLTNATGLPVSGIVASTSTALGVGSLELGHATDTTLSRSSAGVLAVEGIVVPTVSSTATLTNKRITPRVTTIASSATPTVNTDNTDFVDITALAAAITSMTTNLSGTPTIGQVLIYQIKDDATPRGITWGAGFSAAGTALPTTTMASKKLTVGFLWNGTDWGCVGSQQEA